MLKLEFMVCCYNEWYDLSALASKKSFLELGLESFMFLIVSGIMNLFLLFSLIYDLMVIYLGFQELMSMEFCLEFTELVELELAVEKIFRGVGVSNVRRSSDFFLSRTQRIPIKSKFIACN